MLRINLLPAYLAQRRKVNAAIAVSIILLLLVSGAGLGYNFGVLQPQVKDETDKATARQADADKEKAYETETSGILAKVAPLEEKVKFVDDVRFHNRIRQKIFRQAAAYTYREIELNKMSVSGNTLSMSAVAKSVSDIGRFYIYMFGNPDVTGVSISGVPSYTDVLKSTPVSFPGGPPPLPPAYKIDLVASLIKPVTLPQLPAALASSVAGGPGGGPGGPPPGSGPPAAAPAAPAGKAAAAASEKD